jgi:hypothetical protein
LAEAPSGAIDRALGPEVAQDLENLAGIAHDRTYTIPTKMQTQPSTPRRAHRPGRRRDRAAHGEAGVVTVAFELGRGL